MSDVALRFGAKDTGLNAQFVRVNKLLDDLKGNATRVTNSLGGVLKAVSAIGAGAALGAFVAKTVEFADALVKASAQTGIAVDNIQRLQFVATQADVSFDSLTAGINRLQRALVSAEDGQKSAAEALKNLGINAREFLRLKPDEQFERVAIAITNIEDPATRTTRAMDLLGRSGAEQIPLMEAVAKQANEMGVAFDRIGGPVGEKTVRRLDDMGDAASAAGLAAKSLGAELLGLAEPAITTALEFIGGFFGGLRFLIGESVSEAEKLDQKILDLERRHRSASVYVPGGAYNPAIADDLKRQLDAATAEQRKLLQLDTPARIGGRLPGPTIDQILRYVGRGPNIGETDEQRKAREQREKEQQERLRRRDDVYYESNSELTTSLEKRIAREKELDEKRLQESIEREAKAASEKVRIYSDAEVFLASIRDYYRVKEIKLEEIKNQSFLSLTVGLLSTLARENSKYAKLMQGIALAETIYHTSTAIMGAMGLPWPTNLAAAAKVALEGAIQIATIRSTSPTGGSRSAPTIGGGSISSSSESMSTTPKEPAVDTRGATTIYVSGFITLDVVDQMMSALRSEFSRDVIVIPQNSLQAQVLREP